MRDDGVVAGEAKVYSQGRCIMVLTNNKLLL